MWLASTAVAGSGPWSLSAGDHSLFVAVEAQRFTALAPVMNGVVGEASPGGPVLTTGAKLGATLGLIEHVEAELTVPYYRAEAAVTGPGACSEFPDGACATTTGLGVVDFRTKWQFVDELAGAPFSVAIVGRLRLGAHTRAARHRITNLGEGTTDVGVGLAVGRTGVVGNALVNAQLEGDYVRRPATRTEPRAPHDEVSARVQAHAGSRRGWSLGPRAEAFWRPGGVDFDVVDLESADRFASLRVLNVSVGGDVVLRNPESGTALTLSAAQTVRARNNPSDTWFLSASLSTHNPFKRSGP